ncbi:MAG: DM13 domain-containing protein [Cyanobacteria bacterium P01_F01_bin.150]
MTIAQRIAGQSSPLVALGLASAIALGTLSSGLFRPATANMSILAQANDEFVDVDHRTDGTVDVITNANGDRILRLNNFVTDNGPALEVILYENSVVPTQIEGKGKYISLGELKQIEGTQDYIIPAGVNLSEFNAVGIWCEAFDVTFGYATL